MTRNPAQPLCGLLYSVTGAKVVADEISSAASDDNKILTIGDLNRLIRETDDRDPIELLTLTGCDTAMPTPTSGPHL